jgi:hypothetical protein
MPNTLHIKHDQLTQLGQIGQPTVQQTRLLFGSISVHAVGNFSTLESAFNLRETKFGNRVFLRPKSHDPRPQICLDYVLVPSYFKPQGPGPTCGLDSLRHHFASWCMNPNSAGDRNSSRRMFGSDWVKAESSSYDNTETRRRVSFSNEINDKWRTGGTVGRRF